MSIQSIRDNSQSVLTKIVVGVIVVTFALFGVDAIIGFSSSNNNVATVNGEDIAALELSRASDLFTRQILSRMGEDADPELIDEQMVRSQALDSLIERKLLLQDADEQNIYVSPLRVDSTIASTPEFQAGGVFNKDLYEAMVRNVALTPRGYKTQLAGDMLIQQPQAGLSRSAFMTKAEVQHITGLDRQLRNVAYLTVPAEGLLKDITIADDALRAHYDANQPRYMTDETVQLEYLELRRSDFLDQVTAEEAELKQRYEQEVDSYAQREERRAAHILVEINDETNAQAAQEKIEQAREKLAAGEDFASVAKNYSEDIGSAANGGDLGFAEKGAYVGAFEDSLFGLAEGEVSDVVETEFGLHIIKLLEARTPEAPDYDEIRSTLEQDVKYQKVEELFVEAADDLQNDAFSAGDLVEPAERLGLEIKSTDFFSRSGGEGIAANPKVARTAFSDEVLTEGNNSDLIELSKDHVVVVRAKEHRPASVRPFDEVADNIKEELKRNNAAQQAQKLGEQILVDLRDGKTPDQITGDYGFEWSIVDRVGRNHEELDTELNQKIFEMPKPELGDKTLASVIKVNGDFVVIALTKVYEGGVVDLNPLELKVVGRYLSNQAGAYDFQSYVQGLKARASIEKF